MGVCKTLALSFLSIVDPANFSIVGINCEMMVFILIGREMRDRESGYGL
jgi:hypothetical protein